MTNVSKNIIHFQQKIVDIAKQYRRDPKTVSLLAVSKKQSIDKMIAAYHAGQKKFGENFLQEALVKMKALTEYEIEWHYIGNIQTNKTRKIAEHFDWVQSVTNIKIAKRLNEQRPQHLQSLNICVEVNISEESTKSGVLPDDLFKLVTEISKMRNLRLRGLMAIPEPEKTFENQLTVFKKVVALYDDLRARGYLLDTLSLGMSNDYAAAIAAGSTMVRIGAAIFGERTG